MKLTARALAISAACLCMGQGRSPRAAPGGQWAKVGEGRPGGKAGAVLVWASDLEQMLLVSAGTEAPSVQAFDPVSRSWKVLGSAPPPAKKGIHPYYQAAYHPNTGTVYCLSGGSVLRAFSTVDRTWKTFPPAPELDDLGWHTMACDPLGGQLVVVGADKSAGNIGWSRTLVYDIATATWSRLHVSDPDVVSVHRKRVAATEATIDWVGRIRLAWYRDPGGTGTNAERDALVESCASLEGMPQMDGFAADTGTVAGLLRQGKLLDALAAARALQRKLEEAAEAQYPAPCSRRNAPLVFDPKNRVFVLFGGDHEDYLMNDTWVLDLARGTWRRARPDRAPAPRAGHALVALPQSGKVALYEGYVQRSSTDYGAIPYAPLDPRQLWLYDVKAERWELAGSWPLPAKDDRSTPAPLGFFDGYANQWFCPPALTADAGDRLVLAAHACGPWFWRWKRPPETWTFQVDPVQKDAAGRDEPGMKPNQRRYRTGPFVAAFGEVPDEPQDTGLDQLPENRWVRLPEPPRNPCRGCRQRDWGTSVWDSDRDQVLLWGGGHCVRSSSVVAHYSPASGRIVEGYDADEPYGANGGGGFDSSVLNRPWVSAHNYNHYAYDPNCRLLVSGRGYLYDPARMDWLRLDKIPLPFVFSWAHTCVETSAHGAIAWAKRDDRDQYGLWLFDRERGWMDLDPGGGLFGPYCDAHGMVYDSKRDRMILSGVGGGYDKLSSGAFLAFDFKTRTLGELVPGNAEFARTRNARELVYVEHADWVLIGELYPPAKAAKGPARYTRVYDCAKNRMFLLDAGEVPSGHSTGWMYDAVRKLVYVFTFRGEAWALRVNPATAGLTGEPE